jgi:ankyrin repeat protein
MLPVHDLKLPQTPEIVRNAQHTSRAMSQDVPAWCLACHSPVCSGHPTEDGATTFTTSCGPAVAAEALVVAGDDLMIIERGESVPLPPVADEQAEDDDAVINGIESPASQNSPRDRDDQSEFRMFQHEDTAEDDMMLPEDAGSLYRFIEPDVDIPDNSSMLDIERINFLDADDSSDDGSVVFSDKDSFERARLDSAQRFLKPSAITIDKKKSLLFAIASGNMHFIRYVFQRHSIDINDPVSQGFTALHLATRRKLADVAQFLIENGADVDVRDDQGETALHVAARRGSIPIVQSLLRHGADVNARDKHGDRPILAATSHCHPEIVRTLLQSGADTNGISSMGRTLVHEAVLPRSRSQAFETERLAILQMLVEHGLSITARTEDKTKYTPLEIAATYGLKTVVIALVKMGVPVNRDSHLPGNSALHSAAYFGHTDTLKVLLDHADLHALNPDGRTAVHLAAKGGCVDALSCLLDRGLPIDPSDSSGETPLLLAARVGVLSTMSYLILRGANWRVSNDIRGYTPFLAAVDSGHTAIARFLLSHGSSVHDTTQKGNTALHLAVACNRLEVVELLLKWGADPNKQSQGFYPLDYAFFHPYQCRPMEFSPEKIVKVLLEAGSSFTHTDPHGLPPLHRALLHGQSKSARLLVEHGAPLNFADQHRFSSLHYALFVRDIAMTRLLVTRGAILNTPSSTPITYAEASALPFSFGVYDMGYGTAALARMELSIKSRPAEEILLEMIKLLLAYCPVPDSDVQWWVWHCKIFGHKSVADFLLKRTEGLGSS